MALLGPERAIARPERAEARGLRIAPRTTPAHLDLLADAEVAEDDVQDILDIDPAGQAAERAGGDA